MTDEELLKELQERAMGLSFDTRYLINELVKRYRIRCFEVVELWKRIATPATPARNDG